MNKAKARIGYGSERIIVDDCPFCHKTHYHNLPIGEGQRMADCFKGEYILDFDPESDEPNGQDPDGTTDLGLEPLEEEWNDDEDWCVYCQMDVEGDEAGNCPHCGNLVTLIEETDYLEEDE